MPSPLSVAEAQALIHRHVQPLPPVSLTLTPALLGCVLAEDVHSDLDSPPFDKALMDGYAVRAADLTEGRATLEVIEEILAGRTPSRTVGSGQATRIMTGAPIPTGADAVIPVERTRMADESHVSIDDRPPRPGLNVMPRGREMKRGEKVVSAGTMLRPVEMGVLAAVGRTAASVLPSPRVAVVSTGDEVVEAPAVPGPGQIRNSNGPMLVALVSRAGGQAHYLGNA